MYCYNYYDNNNFQSNPCLLIMFRSDWIIKLPKGVFLKV